MSEEIVVHVDLERGRTVERPPTDEERAHAESAREAAAATEQAEADRKAAIANAATVAELKAALGH